jgi:uncharacterized protein YkwD
LRSLLSLLAAVFVLVTFTLGTAMRPADARGQASDFERRVIRLVNTVRAHHGVPPLIACARLGRAARVHSADLARRGFLAHESSDGTPMDQRVRRFLPARTVGETLASVRARSGAASTVVDLWLASPPHRAIMLSRAFGRIGIGLRVGAMGNAPALVVTADFASL